MSADHQDDSGQFHDPEPSSFAALSQRSIEAARSKQQGLDERERVAAAAMEERRDGNQAGSSSELRKSSKTSGRKSSKNSGRKPTASNRQFRTSRTETSSELLKKGGKKSVSSPTASIKSRESTSNRLSRPSRMRRKPSEDSDEIAASVLPDLNRQTPRGLIQEPGALSIQGSDVARRASHMSENDNLLESVNIDVSSGDDGNRVLSDVVNDGDEQLQVQITEAQLVDDDFQSRLEEMEQNQAKLREENEQLAKQLDKHDAPLVTATVTEQRTDIFGIPRNVCFLILFLVLVVGIVAAVLATKAGNSPSIPEVASTQPPSMSPSGHPTVSPTADRTALVLDLVYPDMTRNVNDLPRNAITALTWLVNEDAFFDSLPLEDVDQELLLQRYVLAKMFHDLDGDEWYWRTGWLSNQNVCKWAGIVCNSDGAVENIEGGEFDRGVSV